MEQTSLTVPENPILIIENDPDDRLLLEIVFSDLALADQLCFFSSTNDALEYLKSSLAQPFIIMCSTSLPVNDGIAFKSFLEHHQSKLQGIPFVFLSTQVHQAFVKKAYGQISLQGIFIKPAGMEEYGRMIQTICDYWRFSLHPQGND